MPKETKQTLAEAMQEMDKKYGKGSIISGNQVISDYDAISTGSLGLDTIIGIGGIPSSGKIVEIFGWESSGKSTLCQEIVANAQKKFKKEGKGKKCLYLDGENSLDQKYATNIGVDMDDLIVIQLDQEAGEGMYNKMSALVKTGEIGLVVIDSYNSLLPKKLLDGEIGDSTMGIHSRMMGQVLPMVNTLAVEHGTTFIFIGQIREKIGVMFGSPETTQGGNALKFYAHLRLTVTRSTTKDNSVMNGDEKMGNQTKVKVLKTKVGRPFREVVFDIIYGQGIDKIGELIRLGKEYDVIKVRAGVITIGESKYSEQEFRDLISDNEEFANKLKTDIVNRINGVKQFEAVQEVIN